MEPQDLSGAIQKEIQAVVGDSSFRGNRLAQAVDDLGSRHAIEPFRAVLGALVPIDMPETEARATVLAIEEHRTSLELLLGRDPGLGVAALHYLHDLEGVIGEPAFREAAAGAEDRRILPGDWLESGTFDEMCDLEAKRGERTGRPLAAVVLLRDRDEVGSEEAMRTAEACLRDRVRETDHARRRAPGEFDLLLPLAGRERALEAAERLRGALTLSTGEPWSAGVASCAGPPWDAAALARNAREAARAARERGGGSTRPHHAERRGHARRRVGTALCATLSIEGKIRTDAQVEDLSLGGALLATQERFPPGAEVLLTLRETSPRPRQVAIASLVLWVRDAPAPGQAASGRAAVAFAADGDARLRLARLLADLPGRPGNIAGELT